MATHRIIHKLFRQSFDFENYCVLLLSTSLLTFAFDPSLPNFQYESGNIFKKFEFMS